MYYLFPILLSPFMALGFIIGIAYAGTAAGFRGAYAALARAEKGKKQ